MLLKSPEERANLWGDVSSAHDEAEREALVRDLAGEVLEELHSEFDLYSSYEDPFVETFLILDRCELLFDTQMLEAYQAIPSNAAEGGRKLFAELTGRLGEVAGDNSFEPSMRICAADLYAMWREHIGLSEGPWLTVADVAKRYGVVVQTVYKWIDQGKISARRTPGGGGTRIAARQIERLSHDASASALAAEAQSEQAVGQVRRIGRAGNAAYGKVLRAIERGQIPQLPRRRYIPERARSFAQADALVPATEHVEEFREAPAHRGRRSSFQEEEA